MPKTLIMVGLLFSLLFTGVQAQEVADALPQNTVAYLYAKDFQRLYQSYSELYFGSRGGEVEDKLRGLLRQLVNAQNLAAAGFSEEFITRTLTSIDGIHFAFLGMGPGMPNLFFAIKVTDEGHFNSILQNPQMLGGMVMPGEYAGVPIYTGQAFPVDIAVYKSHILVTNQMGLLNQIIDGGFKVSPNLSSNPRYKKLAGLQQPGHFMTVFGDLKSGMALLDMMGATSDPQFQMANSILELNKLEAFGLQAAMTANTSSFAFHLTMDPSHSLYNAIRVEPSARNVAKVLPGEVLFEMSSCVGNANDYVNRIISFIEMVASKTGGPPVRQQLQMMEQQMGFTLAEMFSHVGSDGSLFVLPVDNIDVQQFNPLMLVDRFGLAVAIKDVSKAQAFAKKLFNSPMFAQGLDPKNWRTENYNGTDINSNIPPGMPAGLNYAFIAHPSAGNYLVVSPSSTAIHACIDAAQSGNSLATSRGYQFAFELVNFATSREFYMDMTSLVALLKSMPEMAPFVGMFESAGTDTPQQFGAVTVEKSGIFSLINMMKVVPQNVTDLVLEQLNMLEMMMGMGGGNEGSPFSRPTKKE